MATGLLGDSPVLEAGREDWLKYNATAKVLAEAAIGTSNPLTIGVFGEWGTGKTSLMRLIQKEVAANEEAAAVWFNAWQYEKEEHLIVPLVATINKELERPKTPWPDTIKKGAKTLSDTLRAIAYGFSIKGQVGIPLISNAEVNLSAKDMIERYQDLTKDTVLARSLYFDAFERLEECTKDKKNGAPRIVVFVDDLDRCFPDKAVQLLEGIKLVLHQPGFSFVLGLNQEIIEAFIKTKYQKDYQIPGAHFEDYLDKIVQVKIPVPKRDSPDMTEYIERLLEEGQVFPANNRADVIPLIADACKHNPRSIIRLLNRVMVTSRIAQIEGTQYDPVELLIHIAMDEPRYSTFRDALDVPVGIVIKEATETEPATSRTATIGQFLSEKLQNFKGNRPEWIISLRSTKLLSRQNLLDEPAGLLDKNEHLCNLLKSEAGRKWLADPEQRRKLGKISESTLGEIKTPEKAQEAAASGRTDPILDLLNNMVRISAGTFDMGSEKNDREKPIHKVTLTAFAMSAMPVTQAQYKAVMGTNPSHFAGPDNPVEMVSWNDAVEFCKKLSEREGGQAFSLPSETQWEYACRAGSKTRYCFGDKDAELDDYAWYAANSGGKTHPVGQKKPNAFGLYDMHGNVCEWCRDWYGSYSSDAQIDPVGPESGEYRVVRGGAWGPGPGDCRSACRGCGAPGGRGGDIGFRLLRTL